ncbi:BspA family leucine-rich repeat surface protein [Bifidobacterium sp. ESL0763]|uniref:BspA family leucine-rich repeat surface protein n=1 Tax=Bifidobacterium sp. ESL0763 TaxID=2983227 RepID=UPI0023F92A3A|nr:BspA family leucine-rich repeat surface protein [Bifidobacterium sp. ESL0763]MDF7664459.1 BspA family leucine-rich repeat surface protein [Bifidobacterium sp. ESL0763]
MKINTKALIGVAAAAAMLAMPALSQAEDIQRSHPETTQSQSEQTAQPSPAADDTSQAPATTQNDKASNSRQATGNNDSKSAAKPSTTAATKSTPAAQDDPFPTNQATSTVEGTTLTVNSPVTGGFLYNMLPAWNNNSVTKVVFTGGKTYFPEDSSHIFAYLPNITEIVNFDKVDTSHVTNMCDMFNINHKLTSLDLSSFDTHNVTNMDGMFANLSNLTSLDLSSFNTSNVVRMDGMFSGCEKLRNLNLGQHFHTGNVTYMWNMFDHCSNLTSLNLTSFDTRHVYEMSNMFKDCSKLTYLDLTSFDTRGVYNMYGMFWGCTFTQLILGFNTKLDVDTCLQTPAGTGYTGKWIQLRNNFTSSHIDPTVTYTSDALAARTRTNDADRYGTYVWQRQVTLTMKPSTPLPTNTRIDGDQSKTTTELGGIAVVHLYDEQDTPFTNLKAPDSQFTLLNKTNGNQSDGYKFVGWTTSQADIGTTATTRLYQKGDTLQFDETSNLTIYEVWIPKSFANGGELDVTDSLTNTTKPIPSITLDPITPTPAPTLEVILHQIPKHDTTPGTDPAPSPSHNPAPAPRPGAGTATSPPIVNTTVQANGNDHSLSTGNKIKLKVRSHGKLTCEPVSYVEGTLIPASTACTNDTTATVSKVSSTRHMPLWIFLLLAAITLAALAAIKRNDEFTVVQHRAPETAE